MTDNVTLNVGSGGDTIAADDIAGVKFQRVKLVLGNEGVNDGDASSTNPVPVALDTASQDRLGALTEAAPATDTASSGINGRLQRIAQHLTALIALFPAALTAGGNFKAAILEALPAGANLLGKIGIDQTTPGTTDAVTVKASGVFSPLTTPVITRVDASDSNTNLLGVNADRRDAILYNDSTAKARVKYGSVATATDFTFILDAGQAVALSSFGVVYTGAIDAIWESAAGAMQVTELS
jgi:hypothetical protein